MTCTEAVGDGSSHEQDDVGIEGRALRQVGMGCRRHWASMDQRALGRWTLLVQRGFAWQVP